LRHRECPCCLPKPQRAFPCHIFFVHAAERQPVRVPGIPLWELSSSPRQIVAGWFVWPECCRHASPIAKKFGQPVRESFLLPKLLLAFLRAGRDGGPLWQSRGLQTANAAGAVRLRRTQACPCELLRKFCGWLQRSTEHRMNITV